MKKLIKYFIAMIMAGTTLLPLTSCAFGGSNTALLEMQSKIEQLEKDLAAEKSKTDELIQTVSELNKSIVEQNKNIENLLTKTELTTQSFYHLRGAYEKGFLNVDDLKHIAYYMENEVYVESIENGVLGSKLIEFTPTKALGQLTDAELQNLKTEYYEQNREIFDSWETPITIDNVIIQNYLGEYNGYKVVYIYPTNVIYGTVAVTSVGGIAFGGAESIFVYG